MGGVVISGRTENTFMYPFLLGTIQFHDLQGELRSADRFNLRYQNIQFRCCILTSIPISKVSRSINIDRENQCTLSKDTTPLSLPSTPSSSFPNAPMPLLAIQPSIIVSFCVGGAYESSSVVPVRDNAESKPRYREEVPKEL